MREKRLPKRGPTQADVAKLAGVSQTTVSLVLNNNTAIAVPPETRQRILDAINQLGYVPDRTARSLRTRKTYTIAGIIPDITNPFYPAFERGIQDVAERHTYDLIMYNTDGIADKEHKALRSVQQGRVDGVIGVFFHLTVPDLRGLLERGIAVVRFEATKQAVGDLPLDNLYVDNIAAARIATTHLIGRGHTRLAMISGETGPSQPRLLGYRQALRMHDMPVDEALVQTGDFREEGGYHSMQQLLKHAPRPTGIFAANDLMAMGALVAIREAGLRVPHDIAVVGFDDIPAAKMVTPPLTTIRQFQERLGQRTAEMLFERLDGSASGGGRCEEMPFELIVRESV